MRKRSIGIASPAISWLPKLIGKTSLGSYDKQTWEPPNPLTPTPRRYW